MKYVKGEKKILQKILYVYSVIILKVRDHGQFDCSDGF